jgi:hypothetical protein
MLLRLFRSQYLVQYILLFFLTLVLWGDAFLFPEKILSTSVRLIFPGINNFGQVWTYVFLGFSVVILYFQAIILNALLQTHRLVERNQLTAALIYIVMMSSQPAMIAPNALLVVNFLLILMLNSVLRLNPKIQNLGRLFDIGFLAGLATLLYFPAIVFLLFIIISLLVLQMFRWREWLIPIIGFVAPWLFVATWYFWFDQLNEQYHLLLSQFTLAMPDYSNIGTEEGVIWGLFALLALLGLANIRRLSGDGSSGGRKKSRLIFVMFLMAILSAFIPGKSFQAHIYLEIIPVVIFLAAYISRLRRLFLVELLFSIIIITIVAIRILNLS